MPVREKLTAYVISQAALEMLDEEGFDGFSMRKLAARLDVDPMAIYHHHKSKDALIFYVLNEMMYRCTIPPSSNDWRQDIKDLCQGLRDLAKMHPGAFRIYETYERWLPAEHKFHEALFETLDRAGFAPLTVTRAAHLLLTYTEAFSVDEISGWLDLDQEPAYHASLSKGKYPTLMRLKKDAGQVDPDADFSYGLNVLIGGLGAELVEVS
jgi:TetR/AcrR family tetracycline transcriptional repressor